MLLILQTLRIFWNEKGAILRLFWNDLLSKTISSRNSFLWNFIQPVVPLGFYVILSVINVFPDVDNMSRLTFVSLGVMFWLYLTSLILIPLNSMTGAIKSQETSKISVLSRICVNLSSAVFDTLVRCIFIIFLLSIFSQDTFSLSIKLIPVVIAASIGCFGVGIFLGILNMAVGDIGRIVAIVLQYGIFISGVIFPVSKIGFLQTLSTFNPLYQIIDVLRDLVVFGEIELSHIFWVHFFIGIAFTIWGLMALSRLQHDLKGRL